MGRKAYTPEKRKEMRDSVLKAARDLFEEAGRDAVTMRRVGRQLGLSAMALYGYFDGKEQLVRALLDGGFEQLTASMEASGCSDGFREFARDNAKLFHWMLESGSDEQWRGILQTGQRQKCDITEVATLVGLGLLALRGAIDTDVMLSSKAA